MNVPDPGAILQRLEQLTTIGIALSGEHDTHPGPPREKAQIRLTMTGDDLVALVDGQLHFAKAWGSGRVRLEAGLRDLFRLRKLL